MSSNYKNCSQLEGHMSFLNFIYIKNGEEALSLLYNGNALKKRQVKTASELKSGELLRVYNPENQFIALYKVQENEWLKVEKMFYRR